MTIIGEAQYFEPVEETKEKETMNNEPNPISMDKKYKTRCGYPVRILCVDCKDEHWPVIALFEAEDSEGVMRYSSTGVAGGGLRNYDLIEVSPYEDFKKDDKVMVSANGKTWYKRHFAYEEDHLAYAYDCGETSWTANDTSCWDYCRKPTQEELGE